jgi:hypothetical protein
MPIKQFGGLNIEATVKNTKYNKRQWQSAFNHQPKVIIRIKEPITDNRLPVTSSPPLTICRRSLPGNLFLPGDNNRECRCIHNRLIRNVD